MRTCPALLQERSCVQKQPISSIFKDTDLSAKFCLSGIFLSFHKPKTHKKSTIPTKSMMLYSKKQ